MKQIIYCAIFAISVSTLAYFSEYLILDNQYKTVKKGDVYLYSHDWDSENPFDKLEIDTVIVLELKEGYVKWSYDYGVTGLKITLDGELKYFKHHIKNLN